MSPSIGCFAAVGEPIVCSEQLDGEQVVCVFGEIPDREPPEWIQVMPSESFFHPRAGQIDPSPQMRAALVANFERRAQVDVVVDYNHASMVPGAEAPAAGWVDRLEDRPDGIWAHLREWTGRAQAHIRAGEYRYTSPVFLLNARSQKSGAHLGPMFVNFGLVNSPQIDGMQPIVNSTPAGAHQENSMLWKTLIPILGLADDASFDDVKVACSAAMTTLSAAPALDGSVVAALGLSADADAAAVCSAVSVLQGELVSAKTGTVSVLEHANLVSAKLAVETELQVLKDGIAPAARAIACQLLQSDASAYAEWKKTAPVIPSGVIAPPVGGASDQPGAAGKLSDEQLAICSQFDLTPDEYLKQLEGSA